MYKKTIFSALSQYKQHYKRHILIMYIDIETDPNSVLFILKKNHFLDVFAAMQDARYVIKRRVAFFKKL